MSIQDNISMVRNFYESYNRRDFDGVVKDLDPQCVLTNVPSNMTFTGPEGFKEFLQNWDSAFPDGKLEIKNIQAGEDFAVCEFLGTGTHTGTFRTPDGDIEATGKRGEIPMCNVYRIENGKIVSQTGYYDAATFMKQLGIMPEHKMHA